MALTKIYSLVLSKKMAERLYITPRCVFSVGKITMQHDPELPELPKIPKKPLTTYMQFMLHHHTEIRRKYPMFTNREVREKLVQMWWNLTFEERNLWSLKYEREKAEYDKRYEEFAEKINALERSETPGHKVREKSKDKSKYLVDDWKSIKKANVLKKEKMKRKCDSLVKPKAPGNAFTLFLISIKQDGAQLQDFFVEGSALWKELPEEKKETFRQRAKALRDKYESDLLEWETKMCDAGRSDLVRSSHSKKLKQRILRDKGS